MTALQFFLLGLTMALPDTVYEVLLAWLASRAKGRLAAVVGLAPLLDLVAAANANRGDGAVHAFTGGSPPRCPSATVSPCRPRCFHWASDNGYWTATQMTPLLPR